MHEASLLPIASNQAQWPAIILFVPVLPKMARCRATSLNPPKMREMVLKKKTMLKKTRGGIETSSDGQEASDGEERQEHPHTQDTLTGVSSLANTRTQTWNQTLERKSSLPGKSGTQKALRRTAPQKTPANHRLLKKSRTP